MKKILKYTIVTLLVLVVILMGASAYMFNFSLGKKALPTDQEDARAYLNQHAYLKSWMDSLEANKALCDTFITAPDGTKLHALYVRSAIGSSRSALVVHGYTDNALRMMMIGHLFNEKLKFNILLPDLRAHGLSEGKYIQMGWKDREDLKLWLDVMKGLYGDSTQIALHGISMGAASVMMLSGEDDLPENVKCVVEDCGYSSVWDEFSYMLDSDFHLPNFPLLYATSAFTQMKTGWNFKQASALEQVKKSKLPTFFIHGDADTYVPTKMVYPLYEALNAEKELWLPHGVIHAKAYWNDPVEYETRVSRFVDRFMEADDPALMEAYLLKTNPELLKNASRKRLKDAKKAAARQIELRQESRSAVAQ